MDRLRFGIFLAPFHPAGENPTLALQRDLELVEHLDRLATTRRGSASTTRPAREIIASPEIFIAAAAERTQHIKLGTGVTSIAYHNPLWVAERMVLLDHLTRGRAMLGCGPGSLPTDSMMLGPQPDRHPRAARGRPRHHHAAAARRDGHRSRPRPTTSIDARLHLRPYTEPCFDIAVAAVASPTGSAHGRPHGVGLLSIGATLTKDGFDALAHHWNVVEERAQALRADRRPGDVAAGRPDAHRRDPRAGLQGRRVRHRDVVPLLPEDRGVPADGGRGRRRQGDDRLHQRGRHRRDRHRRGRPRPGRSGCGTSPTAASAPCSCSATSGPTRRRPSAPTSSSPSTSCRTSRAARSATPRPTLQAKEYAMGKREDYAAQQMQAVATMTERYQQEVSGTSTP